VSITFIVVASSLWLESCAAYAVRLFVVEKPVSQCLFRVRNVTNLRAALARYHIVPLVAFFWYLLVGSTGCGGNEQGFKEGISKLVYKAGEGIFFGNGFHRVLFYLRFRRGFHQACLTLLNDFPGALSCCDVCVLVRVLF